MLITFVQDMFVFINNVHYPERDRGVAYMLSHRSTAGLGKVELEFYNELTEFAYDIVAQQLAKKELVPRVEKCPDNSYVIKNISTGHIKYKVSSKSCTCLLLAPRSLPCKYVFNIRCKEKLPLFDESLYSDRWTMRYLIDNHRVFLNNLAPDSVHPILQNAISHPNSCSPPQDNAQTNNTLHHLPVISSIGQLSSPGKSLSPPHIQLGCPIYDKSSEFCPDIGRTNRPDTCADSPRYVVETLTIATQIPRLACFAHSCIFAKEKQAQIEH
ncbi:hypothetical protein QAD02_008294 [Eretmocerus hayati]|uniref:Uncharacterized protein n=1 Tax=Eretmocerus hayati TaxID=131215 RepID=A0ACC2N656_9HYME|nr:hypothetical protein QAD02_008294 [Eretmocerus hayati]